MNEFGRDWKGAEEHTYTQIIDKVNTGSHRAKYTIYSVPKWQVKI